MGYSVTSVPPGGMDASKTNFLATCSIHRKSSASDNDWFRLLRAFKDIEDEGTLAGTQMFLQSVEGLKPKVVEVSVKLEGSDLKNIPPATSLDEPTNQAPGLNRMNKGSGSKSRDRNKGTNIVWFVTAVFVVIGVVVLFAFSYYTKLSEEH